MKTLLIIIGLGVGLCVILIGVWVYVVQNVETPDYVVERSAGAIEIRRYPSLTLAEVAETGPRRAALSNGFSPLARYIFARDRSGPSIAMTAPVTQRPEGEDAAAERWSVGFILPAEYTLAELPAPASDAVRFSIWPERLMAAIRFSGHASDADIAANESALRDWLTAEGLTPVGPPVYAYYNDPFTPGFLRRNEVLIPLEP
ncbi:MAG: heme-binding protein [Pikeienuella sp.]